MSLLHQRDPRSLCWILEIHQMVLRVGSQAAFSLPALWEKGKEKQAGCLHSQDPTRPAGGRRARPRLLPNECGTCSPSALARSLAVPAIRVNREIHKLAIAVDSVNQHFDPIPKPKAPASFPYKRMGFWVEAIFVVHK